MAGKWDTSTKQLVGTNPADFIRWLLPGAEFTGVVEAKSLNLNNRDIEADNLYYFTLNGRACIIHIEFQSYYDGLMAKRMWKYNSLTTSMYDCPTDSFVIYLKRCKVTEPYYDWIFPIGNTVHQFKFHVIKLWEIPLEVLKEAKLTVLLPLMVLARGGKHRKVVEDAITTIQTVEGEDTRELLSLIYVFASLVFAKEADRHWLKRRFRMFEDALKNSWAYQEIMQVGEQKERQTELQGLRQLLENLVQARFPNNVNLAKERGSAIEEQSILHEVIYKVGIAQTEEDVRQILSH